MLQELRFGVRMLLKQPGFSLIAVLTLALGIGATSAVFSLIQGVLLTPPPYRQPQQLVLIPSARTDGQKLATPRGWPAAAMDGMAEGGEVVRRNRRLRVDLQLPGPLRGQRIDRGHGGHQRLFPRDRASQPVLGRTFVESETGAGPAPVIILGYDLWQRKFNGDPHIIGKTMRISRWDTPPTVIGVMPPGVRFLPSPTNAQEPNYNVNAHGGFLDSGDAQPGTA